MAKKSEEIERQIDARRELITQKVQRLDERVREDVRSTTDAVKERVSSAADRVKAPMSKAGDAIDTSMQEHPALTLGGAFAAGVAMGAASDTLGKKDDRADTERPSRTKARRRSFIGPAAANAITQVTEALSDQVKPFVRDFVEGIRSPRPRATTPSTPRATSSTQGTFEGTPGAGQTESQRYGGTDPATGDPGTRRAA